MLEFDTYQTLLIIFVVIAFIATYVHEKRTWIEFYGGAQANLDKVYRIYSRLKTNGVKCRIKNRNQPLSSMQTSQSSTVIIEIKKGEESKANQLLTELDIK